MAAEASITRSTGSVPGGAVPPWAGQSRLALIEPALAHLDAGRLFDAYLLADIACRRPVVAAEDLLLRGEIAARMGFATLAERDLGDAFAIDPTSLPLQLRMLEAFHKRGDVAAARALARAILRLRPRKAALQAAIRILGSNPAVPAVARTQPGLSGLTISIFSAMPQVFEIEADFGSRIERLSIATGTDDALAAVLGAGAHFEMVWPDRCWAARLTSEPALEWTGPSAFRPFYTPQRRPSAKPARHAAGSAPITVIIPVFADLEMTRACIDSVLAARGGLAQHLVLVDDCGPDPRLHALLADYARRPGVGLLVNPINLGFIGSVNRALASGPAGDVVLLNADTLVAPGWLERLSWAAHSRTRIGTVTPLSNHGELTSIAAPFEAVPMPGLGDVAAIDAAVAECNRDETVVLPNGVGFCLYITADCLSETGFLDDVDCAEGYLEEVDFCLRASERGFTHLCACDVFVGHAGGGSFAARKRGLVMHNLARLERAFPDLRAMTHGFVQADPLKRIRLDLQRRLLSGGILARDAVTLIIGRQALPPAGERDLPVVAALARGGPLLRLSLCRAGDRTAATLHRDGAMAPYRLNLQLGTDDPLTEMLGYLRGHHIARIVYLDDEHPAWAAGLPEALAVGYDIHATDGSVLGPDGETGTAQTARACFLARAGRFVCSSRLLAEQAAQRGLREPELAPLLLASSSGPGRGRRDRVAVFLDGFDLRAWAWLHGFARLLKRQGSDLQLVVFGATFDEDALRCTGAVTVTGTPVPDLARAVFALHGCGATLVLAAEGATEHRDLAVIALGPRPVFSWSRHLADRLRGADGESLHVARTMEQDVLCRRLTAALRSRHG